MLRTTNTQYGPLPFTPGPLIPSAGQVEVRAATGQQQVLTRIAVGPSGRFMILIRPGYYRLDGTLTGSQWAYWEGSVDGQTKQFRVRAGQIFPIRVVVTPYQP